LALYNFHQFLGIPHLAVGQPATLYPIVYLSIFLSNLVFNHYFAAIDIIVILHLLIGALGFYKFMGSFDVEKRVCVFGGLTWALGSFVVFVSNSWVIVSAAAAYFPWMMFFSFRLFKNPSIKVLLCAVAARLLLFYAGHIQYFILSVIFESITAALFAIYNYHKNKVDVIRFCKNYIASYVLVLFLSLPLLLPLWHQTTLSADRSAKLLFEEFIQRKFNISDLISGLTIVGHGENGYLSHIGVITVYFLIIGLAIKIRRRSQVTFIRTINLYIFAIPAFIAFLWATSTHFNKVIYIIPILNRFRYPFKLAFFLDFYLLVIATAILSYLLERYSSVLYKKILLALVIMIQIANFSAIYTRLPFNLGTHLDNIPLEEKLQSQLQDGRIISLGFEIWSPDNDDITNFITAPTLAFNYATLWGLNYFAGCEPLRSSATSKATFGLNFKAIITDDKTIPVNYLREAGVSWYITPINKLDYYSEKLNKFGIYKKSEDENRAVFFDENAYPMVYSSTGSNSKIDNYTATANTIKFNVELEQKDTVIINYLYNPFFKGYVDGEKVEIQPVNNLHMSVEVPEGKHNILIKYRDPYFSAGLIISSIFILLLVFAFYGKWLISSKRKMKSKLF